MSLDDALERDERLAARYDVEFRVISRLVGFSIKEAREQGLPLEMPREDGTFDGPRAAVAFAQSLTDRDANVMVNGRGAYWHSGQPDHVESQILHRVCRDLVLGQDEAENESERERLRHTIERLQTERVLPDAIAVISRAADRDEAVRLLQDPPLNLTANAARGLFNDRVIRTLTAEGRAELLGEIDEATRALDALGPSIDVDI